MKKLVFAAIAAISFTSTASAEVIVPNDLEGFHPIIGTDAIYKTSGTNRRLPIN